MMRRTVAALVAAVALAAVCGAGAALGPAGGGGEVRATEIGPSFVRP
ncbi:MULTISPECIES: hypothetical protein [Streptomyces]|nr:MULTISPECIES: hypothetical protein [Streptomyces]MBD3575424.1 hypothetical protein [Streptomyces sp. KD18]GGS93139.1 hypothetical protein GCM10010286_17450 [Streptomyces toxytricini]